MSKKTLIGGGFPGIKKCLDEKNNIINKSKKREFSVRNIIPINFILTKTKLNKPLGISFNNSSENFNIKESIKYNSVDNILHDIYGKHKISNKISNKELHLINGKLINNSNKSNSKKSNTKK
jgi:hypothetical protein